MTLTWRPLTRDDIPAWTALLAEAEQVDQTGENYDAADIADECDHPGVDLARDSIAAWRGADLVAFGLATGVGVARTEYPVFLWGTVHPAMRRRGIGHELLERQLVRGRHLHQQRAPQLPAVLEMRPVDHMTGAVALARAAGLEAVRHWFDLECPIDSDRPTPPGLDGLRLAPFTAEHDDAVRRAHNVAFAEHWGSSERDEEQWRSLFTGARAFRPELSALALDGDRVAGYALGYFYEADAAADGYREVYLGQIGVDPGHRGRGVASALINRVLTDAAQQGYTRAALGVDVANASGALRLYQRLGFTTVRAATSWARRIPAD